MYAVKLRSDVEAIFDYDTPTSRPSYLVPFSRERETTSRRPTRRTDRGQATISIVQNPESAEHAAPAIEIDRLANERRRLAARLRLLKRLPADHDGDGAQAPIAASVDAALAFLPGIETEARFGVTLDDEGHAVIEFFDQLDGGFASLTFTGGHGTDVECYRRIPGIASVIVQGAVKSAEVSEFLRSAGVAA